ncbi:somatostatin receptor type 5-like [Amphiura filiformis]|uniref:somatostatin receptor type 5-like n=1 Tax=Amphiura filiformis TaxID=82378 RepID=UPI003B2206FA
MSTTSAPYASSSLSSYDSMTTLFSEGNATINTDGGPIVHGLVWLQLYFTPCFYSIIAFLGLIGNGMVILVLLSFPNMKTIPNVYILNLAIVDFVFVITLPFLAVQIATNNWPFGSFMCKFAGGVDTLNQYASIYTLALMSADRYIAVVYPLSSMRYRTKKVSRCLCGIVWVISALFSIPILILQKEVTHGNLKFCTIKGLNTQQQFNMYLFSNFVVGFILPLIIILICYITLMFKIYASTLPITSDGSAAQRAQKRVSFLVVSVIIVFIICWLPYYVVQIVNAYVKMTHGISIAYTITTCWCYANSLFNPFIYTFIGENFKRNLLIMLKCKCPGVGKVERNMSTKDTSSVYHRTGAIALHRVNQECAGQGNPGSMATEATSFIDHQSGCQAYQIGNTNKVIHNKLCSNFENEFTKM